MTQEPKPREWILRKGDFKADELIPMKMMLYNGNDYYHVIEYQALLAKDKEISELKAEIANFEKALKDSVNKMIQQQDQLKSAREVIEQYEHIPVYKTNGVDTSTPELHEIEVEEYVARDFLDNLAKLESEGGKNG